MPIDRAPGRDLPPDAGKRAGIDPVTGEVRGSGAGAGGGQPGEDYDDDAAIDDDPIADADGPDTASRGSDAAGDDLPTGGA